MSQVKEKTDQTERRTSTDQYGMRIIRIAALCFAAVSWYATAQGLNTYVFSGTNGAWEAGLISFAVQSILFVLNLKLPAYLQRIRGEGEQKVRSRQRRGGMQRIGVIVFIVFYVLILFSSSIFSFFHFTDEIYQGTQYVDATITLKKAYKAAAAEAKDYVGEGKKLTLQILTSKVGELSTVLPASLDKNRRYPELSNQELEEKLTEAKHDAEAKKRDLDGKEVQAETAIRIYEEYTTGPEYKQILERLHQEMEDAIKARDEAAEAFERAQVQYELYQSEQKNRKKANSTKTNELLVETIKPVPDPEAIEKILGELIANLTSLELSGAQKEQFPEAVLLTQEISTALEQYKLLAALESRDEGTLVTGLVDSIEPPAIGQDGRPVPAEVQTWAENWSTQIRALQDTIYDLPQFSEEVLGEVDRTMIRTETLQTYQKLKDDVDALVDEHRSTLPQANVIEKSWDRLWGAYPLLARFSFIFAFFLDMSSLVAGWLTYKLGKNGEKRTGCKNESVSV